MTFRFKALLAAAFVVLAMLTVHWRFDQRQERVLTIAAGPTDGEAFLLARAIAEVTHRYNSRIRIELLETQGSGQNMTLVENGQVDLATVHSDNRTAPTARLIAPLYPDAFQLIVTQSSAIESVADLRGHKVALPPRGSGQYDSFWFLSEHYDLTPSDLVALPMSAQAAAFALEVGAVDAVFRVRAPGNPIIRGLIERIPTRLVPIDQGAAMRLRQPALETGIIPKGSYRGHPPLPEADLPTADVPRLLIASSELDHGVANTITSTLFERRRDLVAITPLAGFISAPDRATGIFMPLHPGAQRYYDREKPSFFQENAEPIALVFSFFVLLGSGLLRLTSQKRKSRLDNYNRELLAVWHLAAETADREQLLRHRDTLMTVLGKVVDDAEEGRITAEGFNIFSFTWESVYESIRDRLLLRDRTPDRGAGARTDR
ncbi:MAG: TAXI family TRAP transporter solute-binding subunit [Gemmatimonadota bacterium]|nr:MAG: TAXI family TRAP transporter solute-binding subunit [Gemmatimonadota bacterium]